MNNYLQQAEQLLLYGAGTLIDGSLLDQPLSSAKSESLAKKIDEVRNQYLRLEETPTQEVFKEFSQAALSLRLSLVQVNKSARDVKVEFDALKSHLKNIPSAFELEPQLFSSYFNALKSHTLTPEIRQQIEEIVQDLKNLKKQLREESELPTFNERLFANHYINESVRAEEIKCLQEMLKESCRKLGVSVTEEIDFIGYFQARLLAKITPFQYGCLFEVIPVESEEFLRNNLSTILKANQFPFRKAVEKTFKEMLKIKDEIESKKRDIEALEKFTFQTETYRILQRDRMRASISLEDYLYLIGLIEAKIAHATQFLKA